MIYGADVLQMLIPTGGWVITGNTYTGIQFIDCKPITEAEFIAGFAKVEQYRSEKTLQDSIAKAQLLVRLGITADDVALLLS